MDEKSNSLSMAHLAGTPPAQQMAIGGARVSVQFLRKNGIKLSRDEREEQEPFVGEMVIAPFTKDAKASISLEASLFRNTGTTRNSLHRCLFDPQVISMDARGTAYRGFEREIVDGKMVEFVQVWLVKPLPS